MHSKQFYHGNKHYEQGATESGSIKFVIYNVTEREQSIIAVTGRKGLIFFIETSKHSRTW